MEQRRQSLKTYSTRQLIPFTRTDGPRKRYDLLICTATFNASLLISDVLTVHIMISPTISPLPHIAFNRIKSWMTLSCTCYEQTFSSKESTPKLFDDFSFTTHSVRSASPLQSFSEIEKY